MAGKKRKKRGRNGGRISIGLRQLWPVAVQLSGHSHMQMLLVHGKTHAGTYGALCLLWSLVAWASTVLTGEAGAFFPDFFCHTRPPYKGVVQQQSSWGGRPSFLGLALQVQHNPRHSGYVPAMYVLARCPQGDSLLWHARHPRKY